MSVLGWAWLIPTIVLMVLAHEAGHYWAARRFGVKVLQVGVGLGPKVVGRRVRGTLYTLNLLPVGAFVQLEDEGADGFRRLAISRRAFVLLAGACVNVTTGVGLLIGASAWPTTEWAGDLTVRETIEGSPAASAGIKAGDVIRAVDGLAVETTAQLRELVELERPKAPRYSLVREGELIFLPMGTAAGPGRLGVRVTVENRRAVSREWPAPDDAIARGLELAWTVVWEPVKGLLPGGGGVQVAGPVGLADVASVAVESRGFGIAPLIAGALSIHLGLLNLFPFPGLDGGQLALLCIERVRGRPLPRRVEQSMGMLGLAALMALVAVVCWVEVLRWGGA